MQTISVKTLKRHPYAGKMRPVGEIYEVRPSDGKLLVALGFIEISKTEALPTPAVQPDPSGSKPRRSSRKRYETRVMTAGEEPTLIEPAPESQTAEPELPKTNESADPLS